MKRFYLMLIMSLTSFVVLAQSDTQKPTYKRSLWVEGGAGTANSNIGITGNVSYEVIPHIILSYEFDGAFDMNYVIGEPTATDTESRGFTLGYLAKVKKKMFYVTAGATKIRGTIRENHTERDYDIWSVKIRAGMMFTWEYVAIGISPYVNLNDEVQYAGITANLAFGRFIKLKE